MIKGSLTLIPWGMLAGQPCIALDVSGELSPAEAALLASSVKRVLTRYHGISRIWIRSAPWASEDLIEYIGALDETGLYMAGAQPIDAASWGYRELDWYVDAGRVADDMSPTTAESRLRALPGFPAPVELRFAPTGHHMDAAVLDVLRVESGARSGELEVRADGGGIAAAMHAAAKSAPFWRVVTPRQPAPEVPLFRSPDASAFSV